MVPMYIISSLLLTSSSLRPYISRYKSNICPSKGIFSIPRVASVIQIINFFYSIFLSNIFISCLLIFQLIFRLFLSNNQLGVADFSKFFLIYWKNIFPAFAIYKKVMLVTVVEDDPKAPFSLATIPRRYSFSWITPLAFDPYLILSSVKQTASSTIFESLV